MSEAGKNRPILTVTQAASMLGVDQQTIRRKYLATGTEDNAPISFDAWYRLPGGHIRIYRWGVIKVLSGGNG